MLKRVGRPRTEPEDGERIQLSFRITPELKRHLADAADANGRSQSQEAELRLQKSFWLDEADREWHAHGSGSAKDGSGIERS